MHNSSIILKTLKEQFGFPAFRPNQEQAISTILKKEDLFAVMPTSAGKSLCYQLPAFLQSGLTIVISPLISLMRDQVLAAKGKGIEADFLSANQTQSEAKEVYRKLYNNTLKLLYLSPERLTLSGFFDFLKNFQINLFALDEAHCFSEWGNNFRQDYLLLSQLRDHFPGIPIAAFTATATLQTQKIIIQSLKLNNPEIIRASFNRPELKYRVLPKAGVEKQILEVVKKHKGEMGIIYRLSKASVDKTAQLLEKAGIKALPYHAGLAPKERTKNQTLFMEGKIDVVVATVAFGMGIDKSNIRYVIHGDLPKSMENYYQETGRAGRDGKPAECILFFSIGDKIKVEYLIQSNPEGQNPQEEINKIQSVVNFATGRRCRRQQILEYFNEKSPDKCNNCDICNGEVETTSIAAEARLFLNGVLQLKERFGMNYVISILRGEFSDRAKSYSHDSLHIWKKGSDLPKNSWRSIGEELVAEKFLAKSDDQYQVLRVTSAGRDFLDGKGDFSIVATGKGIGAKSPSQRTSAKPRLIKAETKEEGVIPYDSLLFEKLKKLCYKVSIEEKKRAYLIFTNKELVEIAARRPTTQEQFSNVSGVGPKKMESYSERFLFLIREHLQGY